MGSVARATRDAAQPGLALARNGGIGNARLTDFAQKRWRRARRAIACAAHPPHALFSSR